LVAVDFRKEGALAKGPTLISYIEWEDFGHRWKIDTLEPSESLPQGAEKAEVWRNENYELKAKISGTIEGSHIDIYPSGEPGSLIPTFELKGSDEHDILDYEIGSCAVGKILSTMWKDEEGDPPVAGYEAEILCSGARWNSRHVSASEAEWLSEWYLNGPRQPFIYGRGSITSLREKYERERKLPGNEKDSFEETKIIGGTGFVFVQTEELSFLVQHTPNDLGPSWSKCLSIEYRPTWGGIPEDRDREAIGALVGFLSGRELINLGHTRFDAEGRPISQVALSPRKDNLVSMCQRSGEFRPVEIDPLRAGDGLENLLTKLASNYLTLKEDLRLNEALKCYRLSEELPIGLNLPVLSTGIETLASGWFESRRSKTAGVYMPKKEFDALLGEELGSAKSKLKDYEYGTQVVNRLHGAYNMGANDRLRFFFDEIGLPVGEAEWQAIRERNPMAHGASSVFYGSANEKMTKATRVYQTLFHRVVLKLLGYDGFYIDYGALGHPSRTIDEPSGNA
jgi:hypothetical protein